MIPCVHGYSIRIVVDSSVNRATCGEFNARTGTATTREIVNYQFVKK
jgi:hypothetical protein